VASTPWNVVKNAAGLLAFLSGYSFLMGGMASVIIVDHYIIKKRKLNVHELYHAHGIYWYDHGYNWRGFAAFIIGIGPLVPGLAKSINTNLDVGGAWKIYTFSWFYAFSMSGLAYYVICTYISPHKESLVEEAVYPPGKEGYPAPNIEGALVEEDAKEVLVNEKEAESPV
jgi:cytosine/uracil/thiamine/allantoin permease